jgi:hypothetical protein
MKLIVPGLLFAAAIAAVVWVLLPTGVPEVAPSARRASASQQSGAARAGEAESGAGETGERAEPAVDVPKPTGKGAEALAAARAQAAKAQAAEAQAAAASGGALGAIAAAGIEGDEVAVQRGAASKWGRQGRAVQKVQPKQIKDAVRAYYANLPKSGDIPANVRLEEIFPLAVIDEMNLPPGGRVIELGHYPIGDRQAFNHVLLQPDDGPGAVGVTVITPDGERVREYVFYSPPGEPEPTQP